MEERKGKTHVLFIIAVSITIVHFMVTSIAGHYIAVQVGSSTGAAVAKGLIEATENQRSSEKEVSEIYRDMKNKRDEVISKWKIPTLMISLPLKPVIQPLLNKIRKAWLYEPVLSKKISKEQLKIRGLIIEYTANGLNSLAFGVLSYLACMLFLGIKTEKGMDLFK
ncbi:MAG: hypothetical protein OHK0032_12860 [Thermodesulfovibrionales bacterium]